VARDGRSGPVAELRRWQDRAACQDADPELFFYPDGERGLDREQRQQAATAICMGCVVRAPCRAYAPGGGRALRRLGRAVRERPRCDPGPAGGRSGVLTAGLVLDPTAPASTAAARSRSVGRGRVYVRVGVQTGMTKQPGDHHDVGAGPQPAGRRGVPQDVRAEVRQPGVGAELGDDALQLPGSQPAAPAQPQAVLPRWAAG
jgi:Transcription factor WhiB